MEATVERLQRLPIRVDEDTRPGRMLAGLLRSDSENARVRVRVVVRDQDGRERLNELLRLDHWIGTNLQRMLTLRLERNGERVLHVALLDGARIPARDQRDPLKVWAARAAFYYLRTGRVQEFANGTVEVLEQANCGACGRKLDGRDGRSMRFGLGPDCAEMLGLGAQWRAA